MTTQPLRTLRAAPSSSAATHSVRALQEGVQQRVEPGHAHRRHRRSSPATAWPASASAPSPPARCSSTRATSASCAVRAGPLTRPPRRTTSSRRARPAWRHCPPSQQDQARPDRAGIAWRGHHFRRPIAVSTACARRCQHQPPGTASRLRHWPPSARPTSRRHPRAPASRAPACPWASTQALTTAEWGITRRAGQAQRQVAPEPGAHDGQLRPGHPVQGVTRDTQPARRLHRREAGQAQAVGRGLEAEPTMTAGNSRPTDGASACSSPRGVGRRAWPDRAGRRRRRQSAADFVHGDEGLLMAPACAPPRASSPAGADLRGHHFFEIPRGLRRHRVHPMKAGGRGVLPRSSDSTAPWAPSPRGSTSTVRRWPAATFAATGGITASLARCCAPRPTGTARSPR